MKPELKDVKFGGIYHPLEKEYETSHDLAKFIPKQKHKTPEKPFTTEHETVISRTTGLPNEISFGPQPDGLVSKNPFQSVAQQHFLYAHPEKIGRKALKEWSSKTDFSTLPKKKKKK